jgi:hypothetical protein
VHQGQDPILRHRVAQRRGRARQPPAAWSGSRGLSEVSLEWLFIVLGALDADEGENWTIVMLFANEDSDDDDDKGGNTVGCDDSRKDMSEREGV